MTKETNCQTCDSANCPGKNQQPGENHEEFRDRQELAHRMCRIKHKILVLSGKGGVGKSTVAANLAIALSHDGNNVGLLDVDIHGPSTPTILGIKNANLKMAGEAMLPFPVSEKLKVMSIGFLLENPDDALIWRGPMKIGVIKQFLKDVDWGDLDYLIADLPPGTGDEPLSMCQMINNADGAVIVSTPQEMALADVRKSINFCRKLELPILGVIENMSGFACPQCGEITDIFKSGGAETMCAEMQVKFLGRIPLSPLIVQTADSGELLSRQKEVRQLFDQVISKIVAAGH